MFCHKPNCRAKAMEMIQRPMAHYTVFSDFAGKDENGRLPYADVKAPAGVLFLVDVPRHIHIN